MSLLNVRLSPEDKRLADELRGEGVPIARIVREAIRTEHERRLGDRSRGKKGTQLVAELFEAFPDARSAPTHGIDTTDRHAVRRHIAARLRSKR